MDARLEVGGIEVRGIQLSAKVEVQAEVAALKQSNAEIGGVIAAQQVRSIPLNGRNWADLALAPGAIDAGSGGDSDQRDIRFSGRSRDDNNYTFGRFCSSTRPSG